MIKRLLTIATLIVASVMAVSAQTRTIEHEYSEFDSIVASDGFHVNLVKDDSYATKLVVDDALESYVQCYVKAKTLYISLDEKNIPKDLKKSYKGKNNSDPTLVATVYLPSLNSLTLSNDAAVTSNFTLGGEQFSLNLTDNCSISNLVIETTKSVVITTSKKSSAASLKLKTDKLEVNSDGSSVITGEISADVLSVKNAGTSDLTFNGETKEVVVEAAGGAKMLITGKSKTISVTGKGSSGKIDASGLAVEEADLDIAGISVYVDAEKTLKLDLEKSADVQYSGDPNIEIVKILNSSVTRK